MRPLLGKIKFWEKPPEKPPDKKYAIVRVKKSYYAPAKWGVQLKYTIAIVIDSLSLRQMETYSDFKILMGNIKTNEEAIMWAKIIGEELHDESE